MFHHRGYRIDLHSAGKGWEAVIWPPQGDAASARCIQSDVESARSLVLLTAVGSIDAEIYQGTLD